MARLPGFELDFLDFATLLALFVGVVIVPEIYGGLRCGRSLVSGGIGGFRRSPARTRADFWQ